MNNRFEGALARPVDGFVGSGVNWRGVWTLYAKEVQRFMKVLGQTVAAPVVTTLLFMVVFVVAMGTARPDIGGVPFVQFLAPGLIMMAVIQNAFLNSSSSLIVAKVQGNIVDFLMPPLGPGELTAAFVLGAVTRGAMVAVASAITLAPFGALSIAHPWAIAYFGLLGAAMLGALGTIAGIWADKFDHMAVITNFIVTPLSFLSGTFYPVDRLKGVWFTISHANPFFFLIDGFRYGFTGVASASVGLGAMITFAVTFALVAVCVVMFARGYKLKS